MSNQEIINEIRQKVDIVDIIGSYIPLVQKGKNFLGVCPFHNDTHPSLSVSRDKQIFKCFSCGASGNVFTFLMEYEHIEFGEALSILADKAFVKLDGKSYLKKSDKYDKCYEVYDLAKKFYINNINSSLGVGAKDYLKKRGFDDNVIKKFEIGLALDRRSSLMDLLHKKGYDDNFLDDMGLCTFNHDLFIDRIMIPLYDPKGNIVGFSGRIYHSHSDSKYVNTKETEIFTKGMCLYNYHRAKEDARRRGYVIIMEGYMDVFRASMIGYNNVIAIMGTALTSEQASLIKRLSNCVYICLDGDDPGQKATITVGDMLYKLGLDVRVVPLSGGDDPDSFILNNGKERFDSLFSSNLSFSEFKLNYLKKGINFNDDLSLSMYVDAVIKEVSNIKDDIRREIILKKLAKETNIGYNTLDKRLNDYLRDNVNKSSGVVLDKRVDKKLSKYEKAYYGFIYAMLNSEDAIRLYHNKEVWIIDSDFRTLANEIDYYYYKYGKITEADFFSYLSDKKMLLELYNRIIAYIDNDYFTPSAINELKDTIIEYNRKLEIKSLNELLSKEIDEVEKSKIVERIRCLRMGE